MTHVCVGAERWEGQICGCEVRSKRNDVEGPLLNRKVQILGKMEDAIKILSVS